MACAIVSRPEGISYRKGGYLLLPLYAGGIHGNTQLINRPGPSQGLLYKQLWNLFTRPFSIGSFSHSFKMTPRPNCLPIKVPLVVHKLRPTKGVNFDDWWSCIGKGLRLQSVQQASFSSFTQVIDHCTKQVVVS